MPGPLRDPGPGLRARMRERLAERCAAPQPAADDAPQAAEPAAATGDQAARAARLADVPQRPTDHDAAP